MKKKQKNGVTFCTDDIAWRIFQAMSSDFARMYGKTFLEPVSITGKDVNKLRDYKYGDYRCTTTPRFKAWYQLEHLFKKYIFQKDKYTEAELKEITIEKWSSFQRDRSIYRPLPLRAVRVLREARIIAKSILGSYDESACLDNSRFGRNSSIGCPFASSYLDYKLSTGAAFTGSRLSAKIFREGYLPGDPLLARILKRHKLTEVINVESLNLVLVPKTWKTLRPITPLTLLSLHRSYGIGRLITERLKTAANLDITTLQARHRNLVKKFSMTRSHVTADLSSASDSITSWLLNAILPRKWFNALKSTFTHKVNIDSKSYYSESVLPMGNGATFPCETLIFYCLIKAVGKLLGKDNGVFSVYGDDLIYPKKVHRYVLTVLEDLGITVNKEKTFCYSNFRESCGADYYAGVDVRPFFLPDGGILSRSQFIVYLYKVINALARRWSYESLPSTFLTLLIELSYVAGEILSVPPSFPDTSGFKIELTAPIRKQTSSLPWAPVTCSFRHGTRMYSFAYYRQTSEKRFVLDVEPYYWQKLLTMNQTEVVFTTKDGLEEEAAAMEQRKLVSYNPLYTGSDADMLFWRKIVKKQTYYDQKGSKRIKIREKWLACVAKKQSDRLEKAQYGPTQNDEDSPFFSDWI